MDTIKSIKIVVTAVGTAITAWLGMLAIPVYLLLLLNVADYFTAIWAAKKQKKEISSKKGFAGIAKKVCMFILVGVGVGLDILLTYGADVAGITLPRQYAIAILIAIWLICNELISLLENIVLIGVNLPPFLMPVVERLRSAIEAKGGSNNG